MAERLDGTVALVTGASSGIGAATARTLAEQAPPSPSWRGQGIGRRLLSYAVTTLGARELDVNEQNPQALGFYLRMGFEVVGRSAVDSIGKPYPLLQMRVRRILSPSGPS